MADAAAEYARQQELAEVLAAYEGAPPPQGLGPALVRLERPPAARERIEKVRAGRTSDLNCLTQAVYYEARGEDARGQAAVAEVVMNRVKHPAFPKSVCGVVFQGAGKRTGCQFSFACDGSMRRGREASAWKRARKVAARALAGVSVAGVGRATHFHTTGVAPAWGAQMRRVAQVGVHVFYRFQPRKAGVVAAPVEVAANPADAVLTAGPALEGEVRLTPLVLDGPIAPAVPPAAPATEAAAPAATPPAPKPADAAALKVAQPADGAAS